MKPKPENSHHQPETEFNGELQKFSGPALAPDDPRLEPRQRKGRPGEAGTVASGEGKDNPNKKD